MFSNYWDDCHSFSTLTHDAFHSLFENLFFFFTRGRQAACEAVKLYVDQTLGSYLVNVTSAASLCSQALCSSQGRCRRTDPGSRTYLHLDPAAWKVTSEEESGGRSHYRVSGQMSPRQVTSMKSSFQCVCFPGWSGESCSRSDSV